MNPDDRPADADQIDSLADLFEADAETRDPMPVPRAVRLAEACELFDSDPGALRCVLGAVLQLQGIEPGLVFDELADLDLSPLFECEDDDTLIERVEELRAEAGL